MSAREETSLIGFANVLLKYRGLIAVFVLAFGTFGTVKFIGSRPSYTARVGVHIEVRPPAAEGDGLAAQLTAAAGGDAIEEAAAFFTELLRSPPVIREISRASYTARTKDGTITGSLPRFFGIEGQPQAVQEEMNALLRRKIDIAASSRTGNMWIFVKAPYPEVAQQIANNLVAQLEVHSTRRRKAMAAAEREFIEERLAEARAELRAAEAQVVQFQVNNRSFSSPALDMTSARLDREVGMKQQLYTSLLQSYDRARIEEARSLPAATLLEAPERPVEAERSTAATLPMLGAITGLLIAIVLAFIRERMAETSAEPTPAFEHYVELKRQALDDLKNPLRPLGRALRPRPGG